MTDAFDEQPQPTGKPTGTNVIRDFLTSVVCGPAIETDFITIHWKYPGRKGFPGKACRTVDEAVAQVVRLQGKGCDIYFGLSRQRRSDGIRDQANATGMGSLFADADIDPNDPRAFPSLPEALADILWFCDQTGIPRPSLIVRSGGGLHVYWLSDKTLSVEDWQPYADGLMATMQTASLKIKDIGVTGDAARVLRVPGTMNYKPEYGTPRKVWVMDRYSTLKRHDFGSTFAKLKEIAPPTKTRTKARDAFNGAKVAEAFKHLPVRSLGEGIGDPPHLDFATILPHCPWLREAYETGGKDFDQPQWHLSVLAATFMEDGNARAHEFSNKHPDYTYEETEEKWDEKIRARAANPKLGWPSCKAICDAGSNHCKTCPHLAAGESPLNLGLQGDPPPESTPVTLPFINFANWDHEPVPEYEWSVPGRYPLRQTVLSTGEGAVGKSILKLQLAAAHTLCGDWLGTKPAPGPAIFVDAEDDAAVLHIRLAAILRHYGATFADAVKGGLHLISLVGHDAVLGAPTRSGKIEPTALYNRLLEAASDIKPKMIGIASSADVFAGNEIDRSQVRQFVSLLTRIAIAANGTVSLIAHPSLTGINTGTGLSGNTAWHNSVRARDYITSIKPENGEQPDTDLRQIIFKKNQYGPVAETILLRYQNGLFLPEAGVDIDRAKREAWADEVFLELLHRLRSENRFVSSSPGKAFAPAVFAKEDEAKKAHFKGLDFGSAMVRLFTAKKIWNEPYGRASRESYRIAPVMP